MVEEVPAAVLCRRIVQVEGSLGDTCSPAVPEAAVTDGQRNAAVEWNIYLSAICNFLSGNAN
jgi:hypothetical protein